MKRRGKRRTRLETLAFLVPLVVVIALVIYGIYVATASQTGTLIVEAQSSGRYYSVRSLSVSVTVGTSAGTTPITLSLTQGSYTVTFSSLQWYVAPPPRSVTVLSGKDAYAVGVYEPIVEHVSVGGGQYNRTTLSVEHAVTPVVWVNPSNQDEVISSQLTGRVEIPPMQNFTYVFQQKGVYTFSIPLTNSPGLVVTAD